MKKYKILLFVLLLTSGLSAQNTADYNAVQDAETLKAAIQ